MPFVKAKDKEHYFFTLRRFKRACERIDLITEVKNRTFYEKPTWIRKRKMAAAIKRRLRQEETEVF